MIALCILTLFSLIVIVNTNIMIVTVEISASPFIESLLMYMDIVIQQSAGSTYASPHTTRHVSLATSTFSTANGASLYTIKKVTAIYSETFLCVTWW
jgi:hypothetical protein